MDSQAKAKILRKLHLTLTIVWGLLIIPTVVWWSESILWIGLISVYANFASHWSAYQGTRAEEEGNKE